MEGAFRVFHIVDDTDKVAYLLHYIDIAAFGILCDQFDPENPYEKMYDQLKAKLSEFYAPEIIENFVFHQRKQQEDENAQQFMAALQKLSCHCKFGSYLQTALRNQFVFGLRNQWIQSRLLETADLTMEKALKTATTMKLTEQGVSKLKSETAAINYVGAGKRNFRKSIEQEQNSSRPSSSGSAKKTSSQKPFGGNRRIDSSKNSNRSRNERSTEKYNNKIICYRCGRDHLVPKCTLPKDIKCAGCGDYGHLKRVYKKTGTTNAIDKVLKIKKATQNIEHM